MTKRREVLRAATDVPPPAARALAARALAARWAGDIASRLITLVLARLGRYRRLDESECADAALVFGDSIELDRVRIAEPGWLHRLLFTVQRLVQGGGPARPFVTGHHVHVPPGAQLPRALLIHELTHVWQSQVYGPCYLWQALHAQLLGEGYDYGPRSPGHAGTVCDAIGEGAQVELLSRSFFTFNREQQAQIAMHYFVRRFVLNQSEEACSPWTSQVRAMRAATGRDTLRRG